MSGAVKRTRGSLAHERLDKRVGSRIVGRALVNHAGVLSACVTRVAATILVPYGARAVNEISRDIIIIEN